MGGHLASPRLSGACRVARIPHRNKIQVAVRRSAPGESARGVSLAPPVAIAKITLGYYGSDVIRADEHGSDSSKWGVAMRIHLTMGLGSKRRPFWTPVATTSIYAVTR